MSAFPNAGRAADLQAAWQAGAQALREGRAAEAVALFRRIVAAEDANAVVWLAIAAAHHQLGDGESELAAIRAALSHDPRDLRALIMMADHQAARGDARAACAFYDAAVKVAVANGHVEPALEAEVGRAHAMWKKYAAEYESHLVRQLGGRNFDGPEARRVRRAIDLLLGKSDLYPQKPKHFYFPELPNIEWADRQAFPWMDRVEAATGVIREELKAVLADEAAFSPYVQAEANRPFFDDHGMLGNPAWSAFYLWKAGAPVPENAARCPKTLEALSQAPLCKVPGRTPSILFSLLRPGAHIVPHHGFTNARYICHLPLIVPEGCAMRVGAETRHWVEGEACIFDDSIEHEAWNRNPDRLRVVLIFDVWRPELSEAERALVAEVLQAVDAFDED